MAYPPQGVITKLSELEIDVSKDWATKKIENLGAPDTDDDAPRRDTIVPLVEATGLALVSGKNCYRHCNYCCWAEYECCDW